MTSNPTYEADLAKLRRNNYTTMAFVFVSCVAIYIVLLMALGYKASILAVSLLMVLMLIIFLLREQLVEDQIELMLKHGLIDRKWKVETEQKFNALAARLASELNIKPLRIEIVNDAGVFSYVEPRLSSALAITLRGARELDDKQLEFLIANALIGFPRNLLNEKYAGVILFLPGALLLPFLSSCPKDLLPLFGGIVVSLMALLGIFVVRSSVTSSKQSASDYSRILSITKDYESAKTALIAQSRLSLQRMKPQTIEILKSGFSRRGIPEEELDCAISGVDLEIYKLHKAAEELGLVECFPES